MSTNGTANKGQKTEEQITEMAKITKEHITKRQNGKNYKTARQ